MTDEAAPQPADEAQASDAGSWLGVFDLIEGLLSILSLFA